MNDTRPPLTTSEAAAYLGVSAVTVQRWIRAGKIHAVRYPGGTLRIEAAEVERIRSGESAEAAS
ncbi:MAG TPA: helix-turn-helix domain-containing protein [Kribbellaceae bacterium]|nr:helix-turn-helix domain-containing protein [Kribbellaceae bacterium]